MVFLQPQFRNLVVLTVLMAVCVAAILTLDPYPLLVLSLVGIWAMLGLSWNILGGYGGLVSFGHAAFFGGGAFTVAILFHDYGVSPWIGCVLGAVVGGLLAVVIGAVTFRLKGHYFSLAMLAYPLALIPVFTWAGWSEVALPLQRIDPIAYMQFSDARIMPAITMVALLGCLFVCLFIERTRLGMQLYAIRQNELAAQCAGIATMRVKLVASLISGAMAGLAGALYAVVVLVVTPGSVFGMLVSSPGAHRVDVRRAWHCLGPPDWGVDPGADGGDPECRTGRTAAGGAGRGVRARHHGGDSGTAAGAVLGGARPCGIPSPCLARDAVGCPASRSGCAGQTAG